MTIHLRAHLPGLVLAGLLMLSLAGPVAAQAVPGDEIATVDTQPGVVECPAPVPDDTAILPEPVPDDTAMVDDGEINPVMYYSMGGEGCMACRSSDAGAEEAASEAASSAAERAVDQIAPATSDPAP